MDKHEAGRVLGLADADVLSVEETEDGTKVTTRDGGDRLIRDDGVWAMTGHPATAQLRRIVPGYGRWAEPGEPLPEVPDSAYGEDGVPLDPPPADDEVPDGTADAILAWVGDDAERAQRALAAEDRREHPRSTLVDKLRKISG